MITVQAGEIQWYIVIVLFATLDHDIIPSHNCNPGPGGHTCTMFDDVGVKKKKTGWRREEKGSRTIHIEISLSYVQVYNTG